ncbi:MAG: hypothetical protein WC067_04955 [Candidatus Methanomethylophilaceae archaeon]
MIIPVIPSTTVNGNVLVGHLTFDGSEPRICGHTEDFIPFTSKMSSQYDRGHPFLIFDVKGMRDRTMNIELLKGMKIRGKDIWFLTCIERVEDVFDAFNTDADVLLIPYHTVRSDSELMEMHAVSDGSFPVLFVSNRMTYTRNGMKDTKEIMDKVTDMGFTSVAVFDLSGTLTRNDWDALSDDVRILPFSQKPVERTTLDESDFEWVFRSAI